MLVMEAVGRENVPRPMAGMRRGVWDVDVEGVGIGMGTGDEEGNREEEVGGRDILQEGRVWREDEGVGEGKESVCWVFGVVKTGEFKARTAQTGGLLRLGKIRGGLGGRGVRMRCQCWWL